MSRIKSPPKYALHKPSGQARVIIGGKHFYLGPHGSPKSLEQYFQLLAKQFHAPALPLPPVGADGHFPELTVNELILRFFEEFANGYYVKNGHATKELTSMKEALAHLRQLYGSELARDFGPKKLKAVRQHMIDSCDLCRGVVNQRIGRIKRAMKWAVSEELIPPSVYEGLRTVTGLRYGRSTARETPPVKPVPDAWVDAILPNVAPQVAAMIELQRLTGMRPEEVTQMRPGDIDISGEIWIYTPQDHKKRWREQERKVPLGPKAQVIVKPFLDRPAGRFLFGPIEAEKQRNTERKRNRKSPMTPSQAKRRPKPKPGRAKRDHYDTDSYRRAIEYGIKKTNRIRKKQDGNAAEVPHWFPYQLRHTYATEVRKKFGYEAAAVGLGHSRTDTTQIYAEQDFNRAIEVARRTG